MLNTLPKISVIIPVYNVALYLEECLESAINQTLKDIEIICVNDGSTDNSLKILHQYALNYRNIILINQENSGSGVARNRALKIANGEFVAFMDADDYYPDNDILECLYNNAIENKVLIAGGSLSTLKNGFVSTSYKGFREKFSFNSNKKLRYEEYQFAYGYYRFIFNLEMLRTNHIYFPEYRRFQDPPFLVKAMCVAGEFYVINKITYMYRIGIREIIWTPEKIGDAMSGHLDLLNISRELKLSTLHANTIEDLHNIYIVPIVANLIHGNSRIRELSQQINLAMDRELLKKEARSIGDYYIPTISKATKVVRKILQKEKEFIKQLQLFDEIVIYGAGAVGSKVVEYLEKIPEVNVKCFVVTNKDMITADNISGIPVKTINEVLTNRERILVLIATLSDVQAEIIKILEKFNFKHIIPINFKEFRFYGIKF